MKSETLVTKLNYTKAYRKTRLEVAQWVLNYPETFPDLLKHCFKTEEDISYKAAWILEFVCAERLVLLLPHLKMFLENISKAHKDQAVRPFSKICLMLAENYYKKKSVEVIKVLNKKFKNTITECCFDWLITNQKVACYAFSMRTLFFLGTETDWIHPELKIIIEQNIAHLSAAYKAQGRQILIKIQKFSSKQI